MYLELYYSSKRIFLAPDRNGILVVEICHSHELMPVLIS